MGARKIRSDSTEAKVLANKAAQTKLEPPQKLTKAEMRYWESIIPSRALLNFMLKLMITKKNYLLRLAGG